MLCHPHPHQTLQCSKKHWNIFGACLDLLLLGNRILGFFAFLSIEVGTLGALQHFVGPPSSHRPPQGRSHTCIYISIHIHISRGAGIQGGWGGVGLREL